MTAPDIPDEALEAAARDLVKTRYGRDVWNSIPESERAIARMEARAACLAMLRSWPGMIHDTTIANEHELILPLPQEPRHD